MNEEKRGQQTIQSRAVARKQDSKQGVINRIHRVTWMSDQKSPMNQYTAGTKHTYESY